MPCVELLSAGNVEKQEALERNTHLNLRVREDSTPIGTAGFLLIQEHLCRLVSRSYRNV